MSNKNNFFDYLGLITQLGLTIAVSISLGLFTGIFLDKKLGLKGVFTLIFLIFGIIGGFMAAYSLINDLNNNHKK